MGLSGRKVKQRIPADPRNLSWADNAARFGQAYLSKLGWDSSKGLGAAGDGVTSHIRVAHKLDVLGIGAAHQNDPHGVAWKQNKDYEELLRRLNAAQEEPSPQQEHGKEQMENAGCADAEEGKSEKKKRKRDKRSDDDASAKRCNTVLEVSPDMPSSSSMSAADPAQAVTKEIASDRPSGRPLAHRARLLASKRLALKSSVAVSEILGIAPSVSSSTFASPPSIMTEAKFTSESLTTSTQSVADYFKAKLGSKVTRTGIDAIAGRSADTVESEHAERPRGLGFPASQTAFPSVEAKQPMTSLVSARNTFAQLFSASKKEDEDAKDVENEVSIKKVTEHAANSLEKTRKRSSKHRREKHSLGQSIPADEHEHLPAPHPQPSETKPEKTRKRHKHS